MPAVHVDPSISKVRIETDAKDKATVCVLCSHNCGLIVDLVDGHIENIRADKSSPLSHGYICNKGFSVDHYVNHAQRLSHPLKRKSDGGFERISWNQAISEIASQLKAITAEHSPRAFGLVGIGGQANHLDAPYGVTFLSLMKSRRFFNALAQEKTQHWLVEKWMLDSSSGTMLHPDHDRADFLLVMGTNPHISNRGHNPTDTLKSLARDENRKMVVVDPRITETTRQADRHLRVRPGTDVYLLLAMLKVIVERGLVDQAFITNKSVGYEELKTQLTDVDIDEMAQRCGLEVADVVATARATQPAFGRPERSHPEARRAPARDPGDQCRRVARPMATVLPRGLLVPRQSPAHRLAASVGARSRSGVRISATDVGGARPGAETRVGIPQRCTAEPRDLALAGQPAQARRGRREGLPALASK